MGRLISGRVRGIVPVPLLLAIATAPCQAEPAEGYDLESLAWMSPDIVEAELVRPSGEIMTPAEVRVTAVHKGPRKAGEAARVFLLSYNRKSGADP